MVHLILGSLLMFDVPVKSKTIPQGASYLERTLATSLEVKKAVIANPPKAG